MQIEKYFYQFRSWVSEWHQLQVASIIQREIFAKNRQELESLLEANKNSAVFGFKEILSSKLIDSAASLDELLRSFNDQVELVSFAHNV